MEQVNSILIVGAGIAGLTLATALRRKGINADVIEIKSDVRQQPGVGLSMQGNSLAALGRIGLAGSVLRHSIPGSYLNIRRPDGMLLTHQALLPMGGAGYPGTAGVSRSRLHEILLDAAGNAGAQMRFGLTFQTLQDNGDSVDAVFSDGSQRRYDLVIGADGLYSKVRTLLFPEVNPRHLGQAVWRAGVKRMPGNFTTELHFGGAYGVAGICPVTEDTAYVYIVESANEGTRYSEEQLAPLMMSKLESYSSPMLADAARQLPNSSSISFRPLETLLVDGSWYRSRIMIIGDAAHCGPPVLAQGAAMGIEDAVVLAEVLADTRDSLSQRLEKFMKRRLPRVALVVRNSVQLCEWEVTHQATPQDVGRVMRESQMALCEPF